MRALAVATLAALILPSAALAEPEAYSLDDCIRVALGRNATIAEQQARHREYLARLRQVESVFYPKLTGMTYVAPTFTVRGSALTEDVERDFSGNAWGPYWHFEALLVQPLSTFGRATAGERAASERAAVEQARIREMRNRVVVEVKKFYFTHLMALSMMPTLDTVSGIVDTAREQAQALYEKKDGSVTKADLMKLEYAALEVEKGRVQAVRGAALALEALKHTMGLGHRDALRLAAGRLPKPRKEKLELDRLIQESAQRRPEWAQLTHGKNAAIALEDAERLANAPVLFLAGMLRFDWAPTREDTNNPYHYDTYNDLMGGVAIGLKFDLDPALTVGKSKEARAIRERLEALGRFAQTGIPLQVRKAHDEILQYGEMVALSQKGVKATRKWMTFSALAYESGSGEAKDVLEGVAAYVMAKKDYYDALHRYHLARAELHFAVGR